MVGVERSKKHSFKIDEKFLNASNIRTYKYFGGEYPELENNWKDWSQSIMRRKNLVCANWEAVPITDLLELDHRTLSKRDNMRKALGLYLNKPACNHLVYTKEMPHNAILKLSDIYKCTDKVQGSWWLVAGADSLNECLVSWAFLSGSGRKIIGQT